MRVAKGRRLLVKDSKIFVPLLDTVPELAAKKFGEYSTSVVMSPGSPTF
jgi:hypothetical protein